MKQILIVDDNQLNLKVAAAALADLYIVSTVNSGMAALEFLKEKAVDLILLDIEMPDMDGIETLKQMKLDDMLGTIPVIFLTGITDSEVEARCISLGAHDFIIKPFYKPAMLGRIQRTLEFDELKKDLEGQVIQKTQEVECLTMQTITTFANAIDAKDNYTKGHSYRVAKYSKQIAKKLCWSELESRNLFYTALLHDIGKIGVPDQILHKQSSLSDAEYEIVKQHPEIGGHILGDVIVVPYLGIGAYTHHEWYDGSGYPLGKKGEEIPLVGRIVGIADAVDAMLSVRAYRDKMDISEVIKELKRCSGSQFDPMLVDIMIDILKEGTDFISEKSIKDDNYDLLMKVINDYIRESRVDGLTGLWNRSYLEEMLKEHMVKEQRGTLLMIDLDNFKRVNETWGHLAGDNLLVQISIAIQSVIGKTDIACRVGGDEFALFLSQVTVRRQAEEIVQILIKKVTQKLEESHSPIQLTLSIGVAMAPMDGVDFESLYYNADKSLYQVKQSGKNSFSFSGESEEEKKTQPKLLDILQLKNILNAGKIMTYDKLKGNEEYEKLQQLMHRISKRSIESIQVILFTMLDQYGEFPNMIDLDNVYQKLVTSVKRSLRLGDVATSTI